MSTVCLFCAGTGCIRSEFHSSVFTTCECVISGEHFKSDNVATPLTLTEAITNGIDNGRGSIDYIENCIRDYLAQNFTKFLCRSSDDAQKVLEALWERITGRKI